MWSITQAPWQESIKIDSVRTWVELGFHCAKLDSVQKSHNWYLEYFFLSTNVCCNNWTLEIILNPDSDFKQNSTKFKLAQNKVKFKEQKNLVLQSPKASHIYFVKETKLYPGSYVFNKRLLHLTKSFLQTQPLGKGKVIT